MGKPSGRSSSGYAVKVGLVLVGLVLGVAVGVAAGRGLAPQPSAGIYRGLNRDVVLAPFVARAEDGSELFGLNDSGQYFGTKGCAVEYLAGRLDLVACVGEAGERGYCYYDELGGEFTGGIGLYASDGKTVIGRFAAVDADIDGSYPPGEAQFCALSSKGDSVLFGLNAAGQHYAAADYGEVYLRGREELVAAVGSDGNDGYVLRSDLDTVGKGEVPVYASDGVTVVDAINP